MSNFDDAGEVQVSPALNVLMIPAFGSAPAFSINMTIIQESEKRIIEAKTVNPITYTDLEHAFNESYRELKRHLSVVGYQMTLADKAMEEAKATVLIDKYPEFMEGKPKSHDNADLRKAFMIRDPEYIAALDRVNQLKALEAMLDGKVKVMENVCRYMRKKMDLIIRSGVDPKLFVTGGR